MRVLLDSHVVIDRLRGAETRHARLQGLLATASTTWVSVATIWEIAIKARLGKLDPGVPIAAIEKALQRSGVGILPITATHATTALERDPDTNDPFDRLLPAICQSEGMRLATADRALVGHPLALDSKGAIA
jgi:PIN domain nuclease of toxin-antitoxin system